MYRLIRSNSSWEELLAAFRQAHISGQPFSQTTSDAPQQQQQRLPPIQSILSGSPTSGSQVQPRPWRTPSLTSQPSDGSDGKSDGS